MRIAIINQYYHPDIAATAQLATDLGTYLARAGHDVVALASNRTYADDRQLPLSENHGGVRILRVPATSFGRASRLSRASDYGTFLLGAMGRLVLDRVDVVVALTTPPFVAGLGLAAKRLWGARVVYWVMDVYPDLAIRLGALEPATVGARLLQRVARHLLHEADAVVALDEAMRDRLIEQGAHPERIVVIDNWCVGPTIVPATLDANPLRLELGLGSQFTISYSGNMGMGHDFDTLIRAIAALRDDAVHWLFIGDGPRRRELVDAVRSMHAPNVSFLDYRALADLPISLTAAHASLVTLREDLAGLLVPSKLYGILAAGIPILYVGPPRGRVSDVVRDYGVGIGVRNGDVEGLVAAIRRLRENHAERVTMSQQARLLFEQRFHPQVALERHKKLVERVGLSVR